jgi:FAD/FMN-containing dehydrogenase
MTWSYESSCTDRGAVLATAKVIGSFLPRSYLETPDWCRASRGPPNLMSDEAGISEIDFEGAVYLRGDAGYETARRSTVWNGRLPDRFPHAVVQAASKSDVLRALAYARERSLRVAVCSGGHSWAANHLREGGLLLDVSSLDGVEIDRAGRTAAVGPGVKGHELSSTLEAEGLFFPSGHCEGVAVGGYLLQGGFGWNGRVLGLACESVSAIECVTADGRLVHADENTEPELFWAARGTGPGFFGVVTEFRLRLYEKPRVIGSSVYVYPMDLLDDIYTWAHEVGHEVDRRVEMQLLMSRDFAPLGIEKPGICIASPVFADSEEEARMAFAFLEECPARGQALFAVPFAPVTMKDWYEVVTHGYPNGARYAADNMWTSAPIADLLPGLHRMADSLPPSPSHVLWLAWGPSPPRSEMAYSLEDDTYIALYAVWQDERDDETYGSWPAEHMRSMEHLSTGIQLADENLGERPASFASAEAMSRIESARRRYDPEGLFYPWMGRK